MPYAQNHYPFENKEITERGFPADFIAEGLDQTRGWFYTLNVISTALFNKPSFKNVIVNGIVLAEDGMKMSKKLKNYPDPKDVLDKFGADAIRLYMLNSPVVRGEDLCFSFKGVELTLRQALIPLWNSYIFLSTYAKIYDFDPKNAKFEKPQNVMDRWILSISQKFILEIDKAMEKYDLMVASHKIIRFINQLTNWYIRRSRVRFWRSEDTQDRKEAFETLYRVLIVFVKAAAPFIPFISEAIYQELKIEGMEESLHLCDFPKILEEYRDKDLEMEMELVQRVVSMGHFLRKKESLKVRQPLNRAYIACENEKFLKILEKNKNKNIILEELNVKEIEFLKDDTKFVEFEIKPNFKVLGKKFGKLMKKLQKVIENFDRSKIDLLREKKDVEVEIEGEKIKISFEDVDIKRIAKKDVAATSEKDLIVALDKKITQELLLEGLSREIINKINTLRKEMKLEVTDRIEVVLDSSDLVKKSFDIRKKYIMNEILAVDVKFEKCEGVELVLNKEKTKILIKKVNIL
jgi:isoleucyl-tRNA synthetase